MESLSPECSVESFLAHTHTQYKMRGKNREESCFSFLIIFGEGAILKRERERGDVVSWPLAIFFCKQPKAAGGGGQLAGWQKAL